MEEEINEIEEIANHFGITVEDLKGKARYERFSKARHIAFKILSERNKISLSSIAKQFNRTHATVIFGIRSITNLIDTEKSMRFHYRTILNSISTEREKIIEGAISVAQL